MKNKYSVISVGTEKNIIELSKKSLLQKAKERPDYVQKFFMLIKTKGFKWAWGVAQSKLATDIALGYSSAGEIVAAGNEAEEFRAGDRVACAGQDYASHAEMIFVPKNLCAKIPQNVPDDEAAFATIGAIAMQGIRRAELTPGESVAVVGLGLLGQLAVKMLKAYGHPVIGFDVNPRQVEFAKNSGIDKCVVIGKDDIESQIKKFTNGKGADAALIYASTKTDDPLKLAVEVSRMRGRVVQIGNIKTEIPWRDFYKKELDYRASMSYGRGRYDHAFEEGGMDYPFDLVRWTEKGNLEEFLRLLSDKEISIRDLITDVYSIDEAEKAYKAVFEESSKLIHGIVLSYPDREMSQRMQLPVAEEKKGTGTREVKIGLIGLGAFMKSEILPHLKLCSDVRIQGVASGGGLDSKNVGKEWGAEYATSDYKKLLEDKDIDLIICATRHSSHAKIAKEALAAGKHVYMEKPLAVNEEELEEIMREAEKSKGMLFVGFNRRFSKHFTEARREFSDSGTPLQILYRINYALEEHWTHDPKEGGRLIGEACHFTDALGFLTGSRPRRVYGGVIPVGGGVPHEENFSFTVEFEDGSLGTVFYSGVGNFRLPKEYIEIYGGGKIMVIDNFKSGKILTAGKTRSVNLKKQHKGYFEELDLLLSAIRNGGKPPISLEELYASHMAIFKVQESLKTGQTVSLSWEG